MGIDIHAGDWGKTTTDISITWRGREHIKLSKGFLKGQDTYYLDTDIESVEIATEETAKNLGGAAGWGIAGGLLLGPAGLLAGALLGGRAKKKVTFICVFKDGKKILATADEKTFNKFKITTLATQMDCGS